MADGKPPGSCRSLGALHFGVIFLTEGKRGAEGLLQRKGAVLVQPLRHRWRDATSPCRRGLGSPRKVNGFARGSPTRGAVERSETERLYEDGPALGSSLAKSGSWHRFLYLFAEVYGILVLRFIPPILLGKGGVPDDSYPHDFGVCRSRCNVALHLQVA